MNSRDCAAIFAEIYAAMIAQLKYGSGMPFYRLEDLEASLRIPLPAIDTVGDCGGSGGVDQAGAR